MSDLKLFRLLCKKPNHERHEVQDQQASVNLCTTASKTLPWHIHAQVYGTQNNKVHHAKHAIDSQFRKDGFETKGPLFPTSNRIGYQQKSYSNLNILEHRYIKARDWFKNSDGSTKLNYIPLAAESLAESIQSINEHQSSQSTIAQPRHFSHMELYSYPDPGDCDYCKLPNYSNLNIHESTFGNHYLNDKLAAPIKPTVAEVKQRKQERSSDCEQSHQREVIALFDPFFSDQNNSCVLTCHDENDQLYLHNQTHDVKVQSQVSVLFLTRVFRQIHHLRRPQGEPARLYCRKKYTKKATKVNRKGDVIKNTNSLVIEVENNKSNLNITHQNSEVGSTSVSNKMVTYRHVGQLVSQSSHVTDLHNVRKWHSGMLKVKKSLFRVHKCYSVSPWLRLDVSIIFVCPS